MRKPPEHKVIAIAVAESALAANCKRSANRALLKAGDCHEVKLMITGKVDGTLVEIPVEGQLTVGDDNPTGSTKAINAKHLLAMVWEQTPKTRRLRILDELDKHNGIAEDFDPKSPPALAIEAISSRYAKKTPKRGGVKFQPTAKAA